MRKKNAIIPIEEVSAEVISAENLPLTEQEEQFCQLFVNGGLRFAGKQDKCFKEVFGDSVRRVEIESRKLLSQPNIAARLKAMTEPEEAQTEAMAVKIQVAETLKHVMQETATATYEDKYGITLSPAPLRAVSVNAAKALMELFPIKHRHESQLKIEGNSGNITFNVIVPPKQERHES